MHLPIGQRASGRGARFRAWAFDHEAAGAAPTRHSSSGDHPSANLAKPGRPKQGEAMRAAEAFAIQSKRGWRAAL